VRQDSIQNVEVTAIDAKIIRTQSLLCAVGMLAFRSCRGCAREFLRCAVDESYCGVDYVSEGTIMLKSRSLVHRHIVTFLSTVAAFTIQLSVSARAGSCLSDTRETQVDATQVIRTRELRCKSDRDPSSAISVQFQQLNEVAAGVLLNGGKATLFERVYAKVRLLENDVLHEYRTLIQRFGVATRVKDGDREGNIEFSVGGVEQPEVKAPPGAKMQGRGSKKAAPKFIETFELAKLQEMPLVDELLHILTEPTWPPHLNFAYGDVSANPSNFFEGLSVWRYLERADLDAYAARLTRYRALLNVGPSRSRWPDTPKAVQLLQYLTANGWPKQFLNASTPIGGDGCLVLNFRVNEYQLNVDVALIRNLSNTPLTVSRLIGSSTGSNQLRDIGTTQVPAGNGRELDSNEQLLQPGEGLMVPLRMRFGTESGDRVTNDPESIAYRAERARAAEATYRKVQANKPGTSFRLLVNVEPLKKNEIKTKLKRGKEPNTYEIRKTRESFKPAAAPIDREYVFGPEWSLNGFDIGRERIDFVKVDPDIISLTTGDGAGSCPILFAWKDESKRWERWGKIVHGAQSRSKQETQTIVFDGWVNRFRLAEEELEVAHLDETRVVIVLTDGSSRKLAPNNPLLANRDGRYVELNADDELILDFSLPAGIAVADVRDTRFIVTGYYERYSALLVEQFSRTPQSSRNNPLRASLP
jgi:hypothetical protein